MFKGQDVANACQLSLSGKKYLREPGSNLAGRKCYEKKIRGIQKKTGVHSGRRFFRKNADWITKPRGRAEWRSVHSFI